MTIVQIQNFTETKIEAKNIAGFEMNPFKLYIQLTVWYYMLKRYF